MGCRLVCAAGQAGQCACQCRKPAPAVLHAPLHDLVPVIFSSRTIMDNKCVMSPASLHPGTAAAVRAGTGLTGNRQRPMLPSPPEDVHLAASCR